MNSPKFKIGEEVILQSVESPHMNGECIVLDIDTDFEDGIPGYRLTIPCNKDEEGLDMLWDESAIKKKYKGSEFSFESLMENLKKETQKA